MTTARPQPLPGYILVTPQEEDKVGSFTVATDKLEENMGTVVAIGKKLVRLIERREVVFDVPEGLQIGDVVVYTPEYQKPLEVQGTFYRFIPFDKVMGIMPREEQKNG